MKPYDSQIWLAAEALVLVRQYGLAYLACEERTGKTLAAILVTEVYKCQSVLVLTKKKALLGWAETLAKFPHVKRYTVTTYQQAEKLAWKDYDFVILDESHAYVSAFVVKGELKPSTTWQRVRKLTKRKPIIYISATPYAQGPHLLYHQFALSSFSPYKKWQTAEDWFKEFGIPKANFINGRLIPDYTNTKEACLDLVNHLFVKKTRAELGFEHEPEDKLHYITLNPATRQVYNILTKKKTVKVNGHEIVCDTIMKLRTTLHMLEGGVAKVTKPSKKKKGKLEYTFLIFGNTEKIDYIKATWGDSDKIAIMYNYIAEGTKLRAAFKHAHILQATTYAEGVDLSHCEHLIIYSQDFSTARHTQRRARQANKNRKTKIIVHFLLVKKAISEQVYQTVSVNKENYVDKLYKATTL